MDDFTWKIIAQQKRWLDAETDLPPGELVRLRLWKLVEEIGEVAEALIGEAGVNPRKGRSHTRQDVVDEVADVAITSLVALSAVAGDPREALTARLAAVYTRSLAHGAPPLPKAEFNADRPSWLASLPKVLAATVVLCTDEAGRVLLVRQDYRDGPRNWALPGGGLDDDEPPRIGARREVLEEISLNITPGPLLAINWMPATDRPPLIVYTFDGGTLPPEQTAKIQLLDGELGAFAFRAPGEAEPLMSAIAFRELTRALEVRAGRLPAADLQEGWPTLAGPSTL